MERRSVDPAATFFAVVALVGMITLPAAATQEGAIDPDDTSGRLDVQSIMHGHRQQDRDQLWHLVKMHEEWRAHVLKGRGSYIYVWFSTDREDRLAERRIWIDLRRGELRAGIERYDEYSHGAGVGFIRRLKVTRPSRRTVKVFFQKSDLGTNVSSYKWSVDTSYRRVDSANCQRACFDSAPDGSGRGKFEHNI